MAIYIYTLKTTSIIYNHSVLEKSISKFRGMMTFIQFYCWPTAVIHKMLECFSNEGNPWCMRYFNSPEVYEQKPWFPTHQYYEDQQSYKNTCIQFKMFGKHQKVRQYAKVYIKCTIGEVIASTNWKWILLISCGDYTTCYIVSCIFKRISRR